jgi:hypothetical protein
VVFTIGSDWLSKETGLENRQFIVKAEKNLPCVAALCV